MSNEIINEPVPKKDSEKRFRRIITVLLTLLIILLVPVSYFYASLEIYAFTHQSVTSPGPRPQVLIKKGTYFNLTENYTYIPINISSSSTIYFNISGSFYTNGFAYTTFYIIGNNGFHPTSSSNISNGFYIYSTGMVESANITTNLDSGSYYFVFQNDNFGIPETVFINQSFMATPI